MADSDYIETAAIAIAKSAVASRMARAPLEGELARFIDLPARFVTIRQPSKATKLFVAVGKHTGTRIVRDQRSKALLQAARTLVTRVVSAAALELIFLVLDGQEKAPPKRG